MKFILALIVSITALTAQAEVQVPNLPHPGKKMYLIQKEKDPSGTILAMFRVTGWKSGLDTYTVVEVQCGTNTVTDLAFGEGSIANIKKYPEHLRNAATIIGNDRGSYYEGSFTYNRYRALCG